MALFHFTVTQTKRSKGQSVIASAAYRSGEKLYSEYYGEYSDYTRKRGVICSDILLQTVRPYGTQLKKPSVVRTPSLHTVLKFPCRMNFLLKKTSLWQGNFCFGSLSAGA